MGRKRGSSEFGRGGRTVGNGSEHIVVETILFPVRTLNEVRGGIDLSDSCSHFINRHRSSPFIAALRAQAPYANGERP